VAVDNVRYIALNSKSGAFIKTSVIIIWDTFKLNCYYIAQQICYISELKIPPQLSSLFSTTISSFEESG